MSQYQYNLFEDITLEQMNHLGAEGWEFFSVDIFSKVDVTGWAKRPVEHSSYGWPTNTSEGDGLWPRTTTLTPEAMKQVVEEMENPSEPTEALKELMADPSPEEEKQALGDDDLLSLLEAQVAVKAVRESDALDLIWSERVRQIAKKGYTPEHDDEHEDESIAAAAACYAMPSYLRDDQYMDGGSPAFWAWDDQFWKPTPNDRIRELVKAGALIVAEIERLQRYRKSVPKRMCDSESSPDNDYNATFVCELHEDHEGDHEALGGEITWRDGPTDREMHMAISSEAQRFLHDLYPTLPQKDGVTQVNMDHVVELLQGHLNRYLASKRLAWSVGVSIREDVLTLMVYPQVGHITINTLLEKTDDS